MHTPPSHLPAADTIPLHKKTLTWPLNKHRNKPPFCGHEQYPLQTQPDGTPVAACLGPLHYSNVHNTTTLQSTHHWANFASPYKGHLQGQALGMAGQDHARSHIRIYITITCVF